MSQFCLVSPFQPVVYKSPLTAEVLGLDGTEQEIWLLIATVIAGIAAGILVLIFSTEGKHPTMRILRCSMGFFVAVVWIMAIADEVVGVLKVSRFRWPFTSRVHTLTPWIY